MTSKQIRQQFLDFFKSKGHVIVPSAPIVVKNDPTLMFTNAGMNQFKDIFLGNQAPVAPRVADTQKCLRVSGKHNDLEEVGIDTYHHTMFEMLGNWSFGDYFKKEAIEWAWELLTVIYKIPKDQIYVTIFEGDAKEKLERDTEAYSIWAKLIDPDRIINGNKKDNFWEMGDTGPCGPCSEIHVDIRPSDERKDGKGKSLVNAGHPEVIEIWNNVFIQYNRKADGSLEALPAKHVDTGMGFERLVRVLQHKRSNYDSDVFMPLIHYIEKRTGIVYGHHEKTDIAMRVMSDHIRAISFAIADGQLPSNTGAGYVIRRILRRAVRYSYSYLNTDSPILNELVPVLAEQFDGVFPELKAQLEFVKKVVMEEELSFLKTLGAGLKKLESHKRTFLIYLLTEFSTKKGWSFHRNIDVDDLLWDFFYDKRDPLQLVRVITNDDEANQYLNSKSKNYEKLILSTEDSSQFSVRNQSNRIEYLWLKEFQESISTNENSWLELTGSFAFELYDTYGFPFDLTKLIAHEHKWAIDEAGFDIAMEQQKSRSRKAAATETGDWVEINSTDKVEFVGYDTLEADAEVVKYREQKVKDKKVIQLVLNKTPFYAESGGQVGDKGTLVINGETIQVLDTKKENDLIIHFVNKLPSHFFGGVKATVDAKLRGSTILNHSATHLLHAALRKVLGNHVQQKGSLVSPDYLRFDFSHFAKMTDEELDKVSRIVNEKIREDIHLNERRNVPIKEATSTGAMALFGEKYGDFVRVITFDKNYSVELCGGTHAQSTGQIGLFIITAETAVAAGVRRIEAITGEAAENYVKNNRHLLDTIKAEFNNPKDVLNAVIQLKEENDKLKKEVEKYINVQVSAVKETLLKKVELVNGVNVLSGVICVPSMDALKKLCHDIKNEVKNLYMVLGAEAEGKAMIAVTIDEELAKTKNLNAGKIIKEIAVEINGGGGGQPHFATAGGTNAAGLKKAIDLGIGKLQSVTV